MLYITQSTGPFHKWPHFYSDEIEDAAVNDLRVHHRLPTVPGEVNLDSLVADLFGFTPTYGRPGRGILGQICFSPDRIEKIIIDETLGELSASPTVEHRRRSTLAHEIGHGRLHRLPFTALALARQSGRPNAFVRYPRAVRQHAYFSGELRNDGFAPAEHPEIWERKAEWQANRFMAALLTPACLVELTTRDFLELRDPRQPIHLDSGPRRELAVEVSRIFNVSRQFAALRLDTLFPLPAPKIRPVVVAWPPTRGAAWETVGIRAEHRPGSERMAA